MVHDPLFLPKQKDITIVIIKNRSDVINASFDLDEYFVVNSPIIVTTMLNVPLIYSCTYLLTRKTLRRKEKKRKKTNLDPKRMKSIVTSCPEDPTSPFGPGGPGRP